MLGEVEESILITLDMLHVDGFDYEQMQRFTSPCVTGQLLGVDYCTGVVSDYSGGGALLSIDANWDDCTLPDGVTTTGFWHETFEYTLLPGGATCETANEVSQSAYADYQRYSYGPGMQAVLKEAVYNVAYGSDLHPEEAYARLDGNYNRRSNIGETELPETAIRTTWEAVKYGGSLDAPEGYYAAVDGFFEVHHGLADGANEDDSGDDAVPDSTYLAASGLRFSRAPYCCHPTAGSAAIVSGPGEEEILHAFSFGPSCGEAAIGGEPIALPDCPSHF